MIQFEKNGVSVALNLHGWSGYCGGRILCNPKIVSEEEFGPASEQHIIEAFGDFESLYDSIYEALMEELCYGDSACHILITTTPYVEVDNYGDGAGQRVRTLAATLEPMAQHWGAEVLYEAPSHKTGNVVRTYMLDLSAEVDRRLKAQQDNAMRDIEDEEDVQQRQAAADWANQLRNAMRRPRALFADEVVVPPTVDYAEREAAALEEMRRRLADRHDRGRNRRDVRDMPRMRFAQLHR